MVLLSSSMYGYAISTRKHNHILIVTLEPLGIFVNTNLWLPIFLLNITLSAEFKWNISLMLWNMLKNKFYNNAIRMWSYKSRMLSVCGFPAVCGPLGPSADRTPTYYQSVCYPWPHLPSANSNFQNEIWLIYQSNNSYCIKLTAISRAKKKLLFRLGEIWCLSQELSKILTVC